MKSHRWQFDAHGPPGDALQWRAQELGEPGPGQARVKLRAIGVNRSDLNYVQGEHFPAPDFPSGLGGEAVGEIIALGPAADGGPRPVAATHLEVGARVGTLSGRVDRVSMGVYRDVGLYEQAALLPVPESYSDEEGASLWTAVLTMAGAMDMAGFDAETTAGKVVLFTAGSSGVAAPGLKLARHWGATTVATTRAPDKAAGLEALADHVVVCEDSDSLLQGLRQSLGERGVDLALDPVGVTFYPALQKAVAKGGQIVSYECMSGSEVTLSIMDLMMNDAGIHGYTTFRAVNDPERLDYLIGLGLEHAEALRPVTAKTFPLREAPKALEELGRSEHLGKLVLTL